MICKHCNQEIVACNPCQFSGYIHPGNYSHFCSGNLNLGTTAEPKKESN